MTIASNPPMSKFLGFTQTNFQISSTIFPPIELDPNKTYSLGLVYFIAYNNIPNIDTSNNTFKFSIGSETKLSSVYNKIFTVSIPVGQYEIDALFRQIKISMKQTLRKLYKEATERITPSDERISIMAEHKKT